MPDDFHAYKSNLSPGCSDADIEKHFDGGDDVEWGEEEFDSNNRNQNRPNQTELTMKLKEMFPSKYLKADDLDGDDQFIITRITWERMKDDEGKEEDKPVIYFLKVDKGMALNKTNAKRISEMHGDETDGWIGKKVTLTKEWVEAFGKADWAIRVKMQPPPSSKQATPAAAAAPPVADPADSFGGSGQ